MGSTCKDCRYSHKTVNKGNVNQWKEIVEEPVTKWRCELMKEIDYQGLVIMSGYVELRDFNICRLFVANVGRVNDE